MGGACVHSGRPVTPEKKPAAAAKGAGGGGRKDSTGPVDPSQAVTLRGVAMAHLSIGSLDEAEKYLKRAMEVHQLTETATTRESAATLQLLADVQRQDGRYDDAEQSLLLALRIRQEVLGPRHRDTGATMNELAELYLVSGRYQDSEKMSAEAREILGVRPRGDSLFGDSLFE